MPERDLGPSEPGRSKAPEEERPSLRPRGRPWRTEGLPPEQPGPEQPRRWNWRRIAFRVALVYLVIFIVLTLQDRLQGPESIPYSELQRQVEAGNVAEIFARGNTIQGTLREARPLPGEDAAEDETYERFVSERPVFADDDLMASLTESGAVIRARPVAEERGLFLNLLLSMAPIALLVGFYIWIFRRQQRMGMGMFGGGAGKKRKPVDPESVRVTFDDVAGIDEVESEIQEIVDYLRNPAKYHALGARAPKGVLLTGPPGTGKTLLARATAGEAGVPFFSASASEFIEMLVGVGASRVRELFEAARGVAPSIIFIDEIDTIGRARGATHAMGGHDEREQTLNQILTEMDGFSGTEGVIVLAATNRPDILDPALLRAGRFDRQIVVNPPDRVGRREILRVHTRKVKLHESADLEQVARMTPGMTGADLANLVNESALLAVRRGHETVRLEDFTDALEKVQLGTARSIVLPPEERRRTAYHEAGHALLGMLQPGADPVRKVSIIPRGRALGVTLSTPENDRYGYDSEYLKGRMIGALGGMAAEQEVFGVTSTGAESDLEVCTGIARAMVGRFGMSRRIGPLTVLPKEGDPRMYGVSEGMLDALGDEIRALVDECYRRAQELLREHRGKLDAIVEALLRRETLDEIELYEVADLPRPAEPERAPERVETRP